MSRNALIQSIFQRDNTSFTIEWVDGTTDHFRLCDLQRNCTCAKCRNEQTGDLLIDPNTIPDSLSAKRMKNMGRYALKVEFSSGCSRGYYTYQWLKEKAPKVN